MIRDMKDSKSKKGCRLLRDFEIGQSVPAKNATEWYELNASLISERLERFHFKEIHEFLLKHLPKPPSLVVDIGAGTGRDAAGFAELGYDVTAVEPSVAMRIMASHIRKDFGIHWVDDRLPELKELRSSGVLYDVILLSAVWMHVSPSEREQAFRNIIALLNPGGLMHFTLRHGTHERMDGFWDIPLAEVQSLARDRSLIEVECNVVEDKYGREGVTWSQLTLRVPDNDTDI